MATVAQAPDAAVAPPDHAGWMQRQLGEDELPATFGEGFAAGRIWLGFMTARVMVALFLLALQCLAYLFGTGAPPVLIALCVAYLAATLAARLWVAPVRLGRDFEWHWPYTAGLDLVAYFALCWYGEHAMVNYTPLLALPTLMCAVLGSWRLTLATAVASGALIGALVWRFDRGAGWIGFGVQLGFYVLAMGMMAYALHRVAQSLGIQQLEAYRNQQLAALRGRINDLVVHSVPDGILVVSRNGRIRAVNATALELIHWPVQPGQPALPGRSMAQVPELGSLWHLAHQSFDEGEGLSSEVLLLGSGGRDPHLMVRTQLAPQQPAARGDNDLCLLYLQDMQQLQDQVRTEKLAAMGRMSAAVAHEIRNPLAAISQASQLLAEELDQPLQLRLSAMVLSNVERLGRVIDDVLDIARLQQHRGEPVAPQPIDPLVQRLCADWQAQHAHWDAVQLLLQAPQAQARFEPEQLRRVLVNLLDNARAHARQGADARVVVSTSSENGWVRLQVWSRGDPLPAEVQARLFEPFASGRSRSTGLGLYICRELCRRNGADIHFQRLPLHDTPWLQAPPAPNETGNAFSVLLPPPHLQVEPPRGA